MDQAEVFSIITAGAAAALICAHRADKGKEKEICLDAMCCSLENVIKFLHISFEEEINDKAKSLLEYINFLKNIDNSYTVFGVKEDEDALLAFGFEEPVSIKDLTIKDSVTIITLVVEYLVNSFCYKQNTENDEKEDIINDIFDEIKEKLYFFYEKCDADIVVVFSYERDT